jgi:hypothetical protein
MRPPVDYEPVEVGDACVRRLLPSTRRAGELPRWEVAVSGTVIGWIDLHRLRGAAADFYFAEGIHPGTGRPHRLEGSTDFDERVRVICDFHLDPMSSKQHLGISSWAGAADAAG